MKFEWSHEDRWMSNRGKGPMMLRVVSSTDRIVTIEIWNPSHKRPKPRQGKLSIEFFTSSRCGWKRVKRAA